MASVIGLSYRQETAEGRARAALGRISGTLGIEFSDPKPKRRDAAAEAVERTERWADDLETIAAALSGGSEERDALTGAMERLVGLAVTDEMVRLALVEAGYLQARETDDGWSVSVVGLGPDLEAMTADDDGEGEPPEVPPADEDAPDLDKLSRAELNEYAAARGIADPGDYQNKPALIAAIEAAGSAP